MNLQGLTHLQNRYDMLPSDLVGEQGSDVVEELQLFLQGVTALLRNVHDVKNRRPEVSQSRDGLHLDGVPLLQRVVKDTGGIHHLHTNTQLACE